MYDHFHSFMDLSTVDTSQLSEKEQMQLAEFYLCYRQHEPPQTWRQLQAMGLTKVPDPEPGEVDAVDIVLGGAEVVLGDGGQLQHLGGGHGGHLGLKTGTRE